MSPNHVFSMSGKRPSFEEDGVTDVEVVVTKAQSEGRYSIMRSRWLATFQVPPHYHREHSETFYVLNGQVEWTVGDETHVLKSGDAVVVMGVRGLPRLTDRHEYTSEEVASASFTFSLYTVA